MARRRNAVFHRLSRLKGLPPDEKMLLQRIGNLLDAALNNRQASNPYEPARNMRNRAVYPPTNLLSATGFQSATITWTAPASNEHLRYDVTIQNNDTGTSEVKSTYTNYLKYKGANGSYTAKVRTVGRDGSTSTTETVDFTMGGNVMQIEGSKNGPTTLGTMVQDDIVLYPGYSIFAWGSVVLDKYAAGSANSNIIFKLWSMEGSEQVFDSSTATLVETISLYAATESASNLDSSARGGLIDRPAGTRSGSFETSQSVMFSPITVNEDDENKTYTFFLQATNRDTENDEVNLSLVLWGGFAGLGDSVPGDPWDGGRSAFVFPHLNSLKLSRTALNDGNYYVARTDNEYNVIDNAWTLAVWFRLEDPSNIAMVDTGGDNALIATNNYLLDRGSYRITTPWSFDHNRIILEIFATYDPSAPSNSQRRHYIRCIVDDKSGASANQLTCDFNSVNFGSSYERSTVFQQYSNTWARQNYGWSFLVVCFEGGPAYASDLSLTPKIRMYINNRRYSASTPYTDVPPNSAESGDPWWHNDGMMCLGQTAADGAWGISQGTPTQLRDRECNQDVSEDYSYSIGALNQSLYQQGLYKGADQLANAGTFTIHQMGLWNVAIDNWDGMGYNPGVADQRDSAPRYSLNPYSTVDPGRYGRENDIDGSSLTAIHYLYNQGYGTDINWLKNSNQRPDGAYEYIFAENLVHLWQFGAVPQTFAAGAETLRDTGQYLYGGEVNFLNTINEVLTASDNLSWQEDGSIADVLSPVRWSALVQDPTTALDDDQKNVPQGDGNPWGPGPWPSATLPNWSDQVGLTDPDNGTTYSQLAYPGFGLRSHHGANSTDTSVIQYGLLDQRRPWTIDGVLVEPKQWGVNGYTSMSDIPGYP